MSQFVPDSEDDIVRLKVRLQNSQNLTHLFNSSISVKMVSTHSKRRELVGGEVQFAMC